MQDKRVILESYYYLAKIKGIFTNKEFLDICGINKISDLKYLSDFRIAELVFEFKFLLGINEHEKILENGLSAQQMTLF